jgi:predicted Co/Zn/Cd cation transporter (cation efflux family)
VQQAVQDGNGHQMRSGVAVVITELTALLTTRLIAVLDQARRFLMGFGGHRVAVHTPAESGKKDA